MKVLLYFKNPPNRKPETPQFVMYGRYAFTGFLFAMEEEIITFGCSIQTPFLKNVMKTKPCPLINEDESYDLLLLSLNDTEKQKILDTCNALAIVKKPFNLKDLLLIHVPFRDIKEFSVLDAPALNNAQAVITILRECLDPENVLRNALDGLHSRQTFVETIYDRVRPYSLLVLWPSILDLVRWARLPA